MAAGPVTLESIIGNADVIVAQAETTVTELKDKDRSKIAKLVIYLYALVVIACFAFVIVGLWWFDACVTEQAVGAGAEGASTTGATAGGATAGATPAVEARACFAWKEPADYLLQVLTTAVLPIVTLVLGYYFGTAKADGDVG